VAWDREDLACFIYISLSKYSSGLKQKKLVGTVRKSISIVPKQHYKREYLSVYRLVGSLIETGISAISCCWNDCIRSTADTLNTSNSILLILIYLLERNSILPANFDFEVGASKNEFDLRNPMTWLHRLY